MCLLLNCSLNVLAYSGSSGTITVRIPSENNENVENIKVIINKVADIIEGQYVLRSAYKNIDVDLNKIEGGESYKKAADIFLKASGNNNDNIEKNTDKNGEVIIENLEEGVYVISIKGDRNAEKFSTAIVAIPQFNEISGTMDYNVVCEPKRNIEKIKEMPPKTGDNISVYIAGVFAACSLSLIILCTVSGKRNKSLDNK